MKQNIKDVPDEKAEMVPRMAVRRSVEVVLIYWISGRPSVPEVSVVGAAAAP